MHHNVFGKKLSRTKNERRRLFMMLCKDVFIRGTIVTTKAKAKAVQPMIDKLITKAKKGTDASYRQILGIVNDNAVAQMIVRDAKDRFSKRTSGYTRIVKIASSRGDSSEKAMLSLVDMVVPTEIVKTKEKTEKPPETQKEEKKPKKITKKKITKKDKKSA